MSDKLGSALAGDGDAIITALGMRYGSPSIASALDALQAHGARRILVLPLYPQYAAPTTASVMDAVFAHCARLRWVPELRFINDYHADPRYISALAESVREYWAVHGRVLIICCCLSMACRENIFWPATPITANARRPHACCASRWGWMATPAA